MVLTPMLFTGAWMRATSARPSRAEPASLAPLEAPAPPRPAPQRIVRRPVPLAPSAPQPRPDPCAEDATPAPTPNAREVFAGPGEGRRVALTFDDGPSVENTPSVLRALRDAKAPATFFVLGERAERMPALLAAIADDGHEIGNHGYSHTSMRSLWQSQIRDEVCRTHRAVEDATGRAPVLLRPPFGRYAPSAVPLLGGLGYDIVLWSVDAHDWNSDDPSALARSVVEAARPGSIILMHDPEAITARAVPLIIDGLRRRGFELVPASALVDDQPAP